MRTRAVPGLRLPSPSLSRRANATQHDDWPVACVLGGMDIIRPLGTAGVRSWVVAGPGRPPRYSRFVDGVIELADPWRESEELVRRLMSFAQGQRTPPVLFYENDGHLALISRFRDRLAEHFRFVIPPPDLVEALIDKAKFLVLASELGLPVPPTRHILPGRDDPGVELDFPVIIKPLTRDDREGAWLAMGGSAKAIRVDTPNDFRLFVPDLLVAGIPLVAQSLVAGPETAVESYHVYAEEGGTVVAEFTGKKIRTLPREFGHSTALTTTAAPDVLELGRHVVQRLGFSGVAKLDFKRDGDGKLHLLEVNPRFTLWNHLGARAGVNLPRLVYEDLVGLERYEVRHGRPGVTWCDVPKDFEAALAASIPLPNWAWWVASADIKTDFAWDDPVPFLRGRLLSRLRKALLSRPILGP